MGNYIWGDMARATNDPTLIDEAIATAVATHNADPDAHLPETGSLEAHRDNPTIDHPAESVVNDKLQVAARSFVAIVDPGADGCFDTIEEALDYAETQGGGDVLVTEGTHTIGPGVNLPLTCTLVGVGSGQTVITEDAISGGNFNIPTTFDEESSTYGFRSITLMPMNAGFITGQSGLGYGSHRVYFDKCTVIGVNDGLNFGNSFGIFSNCTLIMSDGVFMNSNFGAFLYDTYFMGVDSEENTLTLCSRYGSTFNLSRFFMDNCVFDSGEMCIMNITDATLYKASVTNCQLDFIGMIAYGSEESLYSGNRISLFSSSYFDVNGDYNRIIGNDIRDGSGNNLRMNSGDNSNIVLGNIVEGGITNSGTGNQVANNIIL